MVSLDELPSCPSELRPQQKAVPLGNKPQADDAQADTAEKPGVVEAVPMTWAGTVEAVVELVPSCPNLQIGGTQITCLKEQNERCWYLSKRHPTHALLPQQQVL